MLNDTELRNPWQSMKTQRTMSMTVEAWEQLTGDLATSSATSRSEVLEVLIRSATVEGGGHPGRTSDPIDKRI